MTSDLNARLLAWRADPAKFVREALGAEPDKWQEESLNDIVKFDRLAIKSGHGVGKTSFLSWVLIWWLTTRYPAKVACTAPSSHQLFDLLWPEVNLWIRKMPPELAEQYAIKADRVELANGDKEHFAVARTSRMDNPDALQGFHSEHMLFLIDECSGVPDKIFEVARGAMSTKGAKAVLTGNPTKNTGYFFKAHNSGTWKTRTVSCLEAKMVDRSFIEEMKQEYGEESDQYRIRVLGEFPLENSDTLIPRDAIEAAMKRNIEEFPDATVIWGLDVARQGRDESVLVRRTPRRVTKIETFKFPDLMNLIGRVKREYDLLYMEPKPEAIMIDSIGMGAGVADRMRELGLPVIDVNVSESATMSAKYLRMRDELWGEMREWITSGRTALIKNDSLLDQLAGVQVTYTSSGRMRLESKDDMKKRVGRSPDTADALALTFAFQGAMASGATKNKSWAKPLRRNLQGVA